MCVPWLIHTDLRTLRSLAPRYDMRDMTLRSYVWHDSFIFVIWHIHDSLICVTWLIYMCDMTHLYVWHDTFSTYVWFRCEEMQCSQIYMNESWHTYKWVMSHICWWHLCMWHTWMSQGRSVWLSHTCGMTLSFVWYDKLMCVTWHIHMCETPHPYVWHDIFICVI